MDIQPADIALVNAFFYREVEEYRWLEGDLHGKTKLERQAEFFDSLWSKTKAIIEPITAADFIRFESLTNMGCTNRALEVTPVQWDYKPGTLMLMMPPGVGPQYGIGHGWRSNGKH